MLTEKQVRRLLKNNTRHRCRGIGKKRVCVHIEAIAQLPTQYGDFQVVAFRNNRDEKEHVAFIRGTIMGGSAVPVRIHSECLTGDAIHSLRCDCHDQLVGALRKLGKINTGMLLYLRQEGRGIGLINKIKAYMLQDAGMDTFEANRALGFSDDERDFSIAAHMLLSLGVKSVKLMTNNPEKIRDLQEMGITVTARIPLTVRPGKHNRFYLDTKKKAGHLLPRRRKRT